MNRLKNQQKEIATIKPRTLDIHLSDADYRRIAEKAAIAEMDVEELLASFIGDLVDGTYSNGSDERMHAQNWYERCGFGDFYRNTFLHYLVEVYAVEEFVEAWDNAESYKEDAADTEKEIKEPTVDWKNIVDSNDNQVYTTKEAYLEELQAELEEFNNLYQGEIQIVEEHWENYLKWSTTETHDKEKEIQAVLNWHAKYTTEE